MEDRSPENVLFVCFGCMSNVGVLTGLAALEVLKELSPQKVGVFCLAGLATEAPLFIAKTRDAQRIITVDGCPLNCALKIGQGAGFAPDKTISLVDDCGLIKGRPLTHTQQDLQEVKFAILASLNG